MIVVMCTIDSESEALKIAKALIKKKIAFCVNIIKDMMSVYEWNKKIVTEEEYLMIIKAKKGNLAKLKRVVNRLHPYHIPEIVSLKVADVNKKYLRWINESNTKDKDNTKNIDDSICSNKKN